MKYLKQVDLIIFTITLIQIVIIVGIIFLLTSCQTSKKTLMLDSEQYCVLIETMYQVNPDKAHFAFKDENIDYCF